MRNLRLFIIAGFLPVVFSCNRDAVKLVFTNARDEVPMLVNFTFRFNKPLIYDSLLNLWDSTEYISFEPAIPGRFTGSPELDAILVDHVVMIRSE